MAALVAAIHDRNRGRIAWIEIMGGRDKHVLGPRFARTRGPGRDVGGGEPHPFEDEIAR